MRPNGVLMSADFNTYLFVYGTLMRGMGNPFANKIHQHANFIGTGNFPGKLYRINWYPGAVHDQDSTALVYGEVFKIVSPEILLPELDEYEDVFEDEEKSLYLRRQVDVALENGEKLRCWTYLYNRPVAGLHCIASGNFRLEK